MKKWSIVLLSIVVCLSFTVAAFSADEKAAPAKAATGVTAKGGPGNLPMTQGMPPRAPGRSNFAVVFGSVTKIDSSDPAKVMLEVKSDADNKIHTIEMTPRTTVTKVTDISELKTGEMVRVMARKVEDKEIAMGVAFGKIRNMPAARPVAKAATPAAAKAAAPQAPAKK